MAIKIYIPPQYAGNLVELDESLTGVADTLISPPGGARWQAVHNLHTEAVNIFAPENEVLRFIAEDGDARSDVHAPGNTGKLDNNTALTNFSGTVTAVDAGSTTAFNGGGSNQSSMTVTRNGGDVTSQITKPAFDGIDWDGSALTDIIVTATEGAGLEEGDVISFTVTSKPDITITFTVGEDDLQLAAGVYALKATTRKQILSLAAGESAYINVSKIEIQAADGGDDGKVIAFFG